MKDHKGLTISQRVNMLRLFIRSSPHMAAIPMLDRDTAHLTETIASDTIDSAVSYLSFRNEARPWCTYLTLLLIDVSSRIAPIVMRHAASPTMSAYRVILSMIHAQDCLRNLGKSKLSITRRALARLNEISDDANLAYAMAASIPRFTGTDDAFPGGSDKQCEGVADSAQNHLANNDWMLDHSQFWYAGDLADLFSSEEFPLDF